MQTRGRGRIRFGFLVGRLEGNLIGVPNGEWTTNKQIGTLKRHGHHVLNVFTGLRWAAHCRVVHRVTSHWGAVI